MLLEDHARWLLVLHVALSAALVGAATHLALWTRGWARGQFGRRAAARKFAVLTLALYVANFVLGNLLYPTYKVRVRYEYLDHTGALIRDHEARLTARARAEAHYQSLVEARARRGDDADRSADDNGATADPAGASADAADAAARAEAPLSDAEIAARGAHIPRRAAQIARWFDVKEHWMALGLALAAACTVILLVYNPKRHGRAIARIAFLMAAAVALTVWMGAVIGVVVSSYRAVGGFG